MMSGIRVRVSASPRSADPPAADDDAFGCALLDQVLGVLARTPTPPAAVLLLRPDTVNIVYVGPLFAATQDPHRVIASLAGQPEVEAVALLGRFTHRLPTGPPRLLAGVFVEWPDGRWWASWRPISEAGRLIPTDEDEVLRAVDGTPRPHGLGGWFSRARFQGLRAELRPVAPAERRDEVVN